jgi:hypothetical protein
MPDQRFPYGTQRAQFMLAVAFFGACGALFVYLGLAGVPVRLWPLPTSVSGPPVFALAAVSFAFVGVGAAQLVRSRSLGPRELVLGDAFLEAPRSPWTSDTIRVERSAIRNVREQEVMGTRIVTIDLDGRKLTLSNRTVGDDGYAAVKAWIAKGR